MCINGWWDGVRQTEQGSSQWWPVIGPEAMGQTEMQKIPFKKKTLTKKEKSPRQPWGLKNTGYIDNWMADLTQHSMGDHIPARRAFSAWKFWVDTLKTAKYLCRAWQGPLKGKNFSKYFFLHIYLAIHTQPWKRLSTVIKFLLIHFCFTCQQTKSLTPPSSVQLIEHFRISSASCYVSTLTREPEAQQDTLQSTIQQKRCQAWGRLKGNCTQKMQGKG